MAKGQDVTAWLPISTLRFDPRVNRPINEQRVKKIAAEFDPDAFGVAVVSERSDGSHVVIDGQHRIKALLDMGWDDQKVECKIHRGLCVKQEAGLFIKLNRSQKPSAIEEFPKRVTMGEPVAVAINDILERCHLVPDGQPADGHIACVSSLEKIYTGARFTADRVQPKVLEQTLTVAIEAWGRTKAAVQGDVLLGLGWVIHQYGNQIETENLIAKLAGFAGGPGRLLGVARGLRDIKPWSVADCVADTIVATYNRQKRTGKLAEWRRS